jgi:single-stranded-DNA-specific exonuclease
VLQLIGAHRTGYFIPHRFTDGYGIHQAALEKAREEGYKLIISVDCGIRAYEPLVWAQSVGLDCIVTDHHLADGERGAPPAYAVINPNQPLCPYPDKNLAGVGVAFKLAQALLRERGLEDLAKGFLKVVAIGTVADVAPLTGENRTIVALGLADLPGATNLGLRALLNVAGCCDEAGRAKTMLASDLGFRLGPRINAAGRMDAARAVVELFEAETPAEAERLATHLDSRNRERQAMQREITERAILELDSLDTAHSHVAVVCGDKWHRGVIGLAASKISERTNRPAVVISCDGDFGHGSARSIETYHLLDGLTACADLFEQFGGHAHAAGLLIKREHIPELRRRLNEHAAAKMTDADLIPVIHVDAALTPEMITLRLAEDLRALEPFGANWRRPVFTTGDLIVAAPPRVLKERHLKFYLQDEYRRFNFEAVWWGGAEADGRTPSVGERIELAYALELNTWRDETRLQLVVEDLRRAGVGAD